MQTREFVERQRPQVSPNPYVDVQVDRLYRGRPVVKALLRKVRRKLLGPSKGIAPAVIYNGLVVLDRPDLYGEGIFYEPDFWRTLLLLDLKPCERVLEFCAGPGYIGYSLLAHGFCQELTLADVNPAAVEVARQTARFNGVEHLVNIYLSDGLKQIPENEKWDLVLGNPPHLPAETPEAVADRISYDPAWALHREFYSSVKQFMKPGGRVLLMEEIPASNVDLFEPMIRAGGGRVVTTRFRTDFRGNPFGEYYLLSAW